MNKSEKKKIRDYLEYHWGPRKIVFHKDGSVTGVLPVPGSSRERYRDYRAFLGWDTRLLSEAEAWASRWTGAAGSSRTDAP